MIDALQSQPAVLREAFEKCRKHFLYAMLFSALLNLLFIAPMLYMLQVYDRVIPTGGGMTLFFITLVLLFALGTLALLDWVRSRLLVRASIELDHNLAPEILEAALARLAAVDERVADLEDRIVESARCGTGVLVDRQEPNGAWYARGATRMDDQQHAISGLLATADL